MGRASVGFVVFVLVVMALSVRAGSISGKSCSKRESCSECLESGCDYDPIAKKCSKVEKSKSDPKMWYGKEEKLDTDRVGAMCERATSLVEGNYWDTATLSTIVRQTSGRFRDFAKIVKSSRKGLASLKEAAEENKKIAGLLARIETLGKELAETDFTASSAADVQKKVKEAMSYMDQVEESAGTLAQYHQDAASAVEKLESAGGFEKCEAVRRAKQDFRAVEKGLTMHSVPNTFTQSITLMVKRAAGALDPTQIIASYPEVSSDFNVVKALVAKVTCYRTDDSLFKKQISSGNLKEIVRAFNAGLRELMGASARIQEYFESKVESLRKSLPRRAPRDLRGNPCGILNYVPFRMLFHDERTSDISQEWETLSERIRNVGGHQIALGEGVIENMQSQSRNMRIYSGMARQCLSRVESFAARAETLMSGDLRGEDKEMVFSHNGFKVRVEDGEPCSAVEKYEEIRSDLAAYDDVLNTARKMERNLAIWPNELRHLYEVSTTQKKAWESRAGRVVRRKRRACDAAKQDALDRLDKLLEKVPTFLSETLRQYRHADPSHPEVREGNAKCAMIAAVIQNRQNVPLDPRQTEILDQIARMAKYVYKKDGREEADCNYALFSMKGMESVFGGGTKFSSLCSELSLSC